MDCRDGIVMINRAVDMQKRIESPPCRGTALIDNHFTALEKKKPALPGVWRFKKKQYRFLQIILSHSLNVFPLEEKDRLVCTYFKVWMRVKRFYTLNGKM